MENQSQFYQLLSDYMEEAITKKRPLDDLNDTWNKLLSMVEQDRVPPTIVVDSVSRIFSQYSSAKHFLLVIMQSIVAVSTMKGGYTYPEFFWIAVKADIFSDNNISDLMHVLTTFCDRQVLRAYLTYMLITSEKDRQKDVVYAFYYVGYTVESLKIVAQLLPIGADNLELYNYIFGCLVGFVFGERATSISPEEMPWLRDFLTKGTNLGNAEITENCNKVLTRLDKLQLGLMNGS